MGLLGSSSDYRLLFERATHADDLMLDRAVTLPAIVGFRPYTIQSLCGWRG